MTQTVLKNSAAAEPVRPVTDRLALIAMMLGAVSFFDAGLTSVAAIIVGVIALVRIRRGQATGLVMAWLGVVFGFIALVAVLVLGGVWLNAQHQDAANRQHVQTTTRHVETVRQNVIADVHDTTANVKTYLGKNPDATLDEILKHVTVVNSDPQHGEAVVIGSASGSNATAYKAWTVLGTDAALNPNANYNYQSYSNTFRWSDNKTQKATDITADKTPRNARALGN